MFRVPPIEAEVTDEGAKSNVTKLMPVWEYTGEDCIAGLAGVNAAEAAIKSLFRYAT